MARCSASDDCGRPGSRMTRYCSRTRCDFSVSRMRSAVALPAMRWISRCSAALSVKSRRNLRLRRRRACRSRCAQRVAGGGIDAFRRLPRHHRLDDEPRSGDLKGLGVGDRAHARTAIALAQDQAFLVEHGERGADMRAVDAELPGEVGLDQPLVWHQPAARDRLAQAQGHVGSGRWCGEGVWSSRVTIWVTKLLTIRARGSSLGAGNSRRHPQQYEKACTRMPAATTLKIAIGDYPHTLPLKRGEMPRPGSSSTSSK